MDNLGIDSIAHQRAVHKNITTRHTFADFDALLRKSQNVPVFHHSDILFRNTDLLRQQCVLFQVAQFAVNRHEELGAQDVEQHLLLFLAGMAGDVYRCDRVIDNIRPFLEKAVDHPVNGFFVTGDSVRREHNRIAGDNTQRGVSSRRQPP